MTKKDELFTVVRQWVEKAEEDFRNAEYTLTLKERCPLNTVCFHAQQCVEKYLKLTPPTKYAVELEDFNGALCPRIYFVPPTTTSYWSDDAQKTVYEASPRISIEFSTQNFSSGGFATGQKENGASLKTLNGAPWYYKKLDGETSFVIGEIYEAFVENTQLRFTILLDFLDGTKSTKQIKADYDKMMKTVSIRTDVPSNIQGAAALTKEMLALGGTWKMMKQFAAEDIAAGYDKNPKAGSPVKAHLIAFRDNKICSYIQEESPKECYSRYGLFTLDGNILKFKESGDDVSWEILNNTSSELEVIETKNGSKAIYQKTSTEVPPDR
jgi:hypothetical protein